ncbi:glycosyltransferase [Flavobacterium sp. GT3R68]|uniref:glycosyltransferase n=1 Tax=Flavobacterium sp. GT3R68 TaxID=2594437 RepID=UPI000F887214|nr:glycosyltransferase [Flavobacterium sp. GT3R68]RTY95288.1 glycosyltransferase [Flavobacterium sp. GSN2]TRW90971.1 glycosyltransferase [Flavobacterium sp. GT3R68]
MITDKAQIDSRKRNSVNENTLPEILFITSYPPRECGIATYSQDLITALNEKFGQSVKIRICPLESENEKHSYSDEIKYVLTTDDAESYTGLIQNINNSPNIQLVLIQHEFGLFKNDDYFNQFLYALTKPVVIVFHTVLPHPNEAFQLKVQQLNDAAESIIVMTHSSAEILTRDYGVAPEKITIISHGTHLVKHMDKDALKEKYNVSGKKILSTFGLISSGKSIETSLNALPAIIKEHPDILFLIIGKTHPSVIKEQGEQYRKMLEDKIEALGIQEYVQFKNSFLPLPQLLEYLQLTDIYLFTSKDPNQAVSGTFSYAISCGCPVVCTPIPHAVEVIKDNAGIKIDFGNSKQLAEAVNRLLNDEHLMQSLSSNSLHRMASTTWENSALAHASLLEQITHNKISLCYTMPEIKLHHVKNMTTNFGIIQFSKMNLPDIDSGYTLDDNARALIAVCMYYEMTHDDETLRLINTYFKFIKYCQQPEGYFLNYVNDEKKFTSENNSANLADANGRAIWALGFMISMQDILPESLIFEAEDVMQHALVTINKIHSTRAMGFIIKGLYYHNLHHETEKDISVIKELANRLVQMYKHESDKDWNWFESYLTYANSLLSEAMICAWLATNEPIYKEIAKSSFDFLLSLTYKKDTLQVISNKTWLHRGENPIKETSNAAGGEQPIDVAYTILALSKFHDVFQDDGYLNKMEMSFNWFLGNNHLNQIIYNPCTGGCYDGLEENYVNLNQGAESTISYLIARLTVEQALNKEQKSIPYSIRSKKRHYLALNEYH